MLGTIYLTSVMGCEVDTKERIIETALDLFSKKGFEAVSVRDISGKIGIKESSLYYHFKNKQEIFEVIVDTCIKKRRSI